MKALESIAGKGENAYQFVAYFTHGLWVSGSITGFSKLPWGDSSSVTSDACEKIGQKEKVVSAVVRKPGYSLIDRIVFNVVVSHIMAASAPIHAFLIVWCLLLSTVISWQPVHLSMLS